MKRFIVHAGRVPALESHPEGGFVYYADARAVIDGLQALLNERDAELDRHRETARQLDELVMDCFRKDPAMAARVCASLGVPVPTL